VARYKHYDYGQSKLIPVHFDRQVLPGTFEHTLSYLIEHECDLSWFEERYRNDETGAPAYDPAILLKVILFAYSRGITSSRAIARACEENVVFMALSADSRPHFTTIASFVSTMGEGATQLFRDVLLVCDEQGLIGREMFAVDGVKLPSNASKEWSGTRSDFERKAKKMETAMEALVRRHRQSDEGAARRQGGGDGGDDGGPSERAQRTLERLEKNLAKVRGFLATGEEKLGRRGKPVKSNLTDNESAMMSSTHGVIQGCSHRGLSGDYEVVRFRGTNAICGGCERRERCIRHPGRTPFRQVAFFGARRPSRTQELVRQMRDKVDSAAGRLKYGLRLGIAEPPFANLRSTLGLDRFTLRGRRKVNAQWLLFTMVHNIGKLNRFGYADG